MPNSLQHSKFRRELELLVELLRQRGWQAELGCPAELHWDGQRALFQQQRLGFILNRSTDFFWRGNLFSALRNAYRAGSAYVAPNPSPMRRAAISGSWSGSHCPIGARTSEPSPRNVAS